MFKGLKRKASIFIWTIDSLLACSVPHIIPLDCIQQTKNEASFIMQEVSFLFKCFFYLQLMINHRICFVDDKQKNVTIKD